jgi:hypothetical protein
MRGVAVLAGSVVALVACAASAASTKPHPIAFGIGGGTIVPWQVTIEPDGRVRRDEITDPPRHRIRHAEFVSLSRLVRRDLVAGLASRRCPNINPDVGSRFVRDFGRTVSVHGDCESRFNTLWDTLARAVGLTFS